MFSPGSLRDAIRHRSESARQSGALHPIDTHAEFIDDGGVRFLVRVAASLARKHAQSQPNRTSANSADAESSHNPFLPPDLDLLVSDLAPHHVCLLNKYSVVDEHLLIVTRSFERQESPLNFDDFVALWTCMHEYDALAFYNSGVEAGASQPHKHLQMVPLPLASDGDPIPLETVLQQESPLRDPLHFPSLPFRHGLTRLEPCKQIADQARASCQHYDRLLAVNGIDPRNPSPYNLLVTRRWMFLVPRSRECFESISLNALAFAGTFFVRDPQQLSRLRAAGPMSALRHVGISW